MSHRRVRVSFLIAIVIILAAIPLQAEQVTADREVPVDLNTPLPLLADTLDLQVLGSTLWAGAATAEISGNYAFVVLLHGLMVFDISTASVPTLVAEMYLQGGYTIELMGNYALIGTAVPGLVIVDISNPLAPFIIAEHETVEESCRTIHVHGNYAVLGMSGGPIEIVDLSDPYTPVRTDWHDTWALVGQSQIVGDLLYVADYGSLEILDISDPYNITLISEYSDPSYLYGVTVLGDYAYIACYYDMQILDISDPAAPTYVGVYDTPGNCSRVESLDGYLYVSDSDVGYVVLDISSPATPSFVTNVDAAITIRFGGNYGLAFSYYLLEVVDLTNVFAPVTVAEVEFPSKINEAFVVGGTAYLAHDDEGLTVVDVSNVNAPIVIGNYPTSSDVHGVYVEGNLAYLATANDGLVIVDVTDPTAPTYVGDYDISPRTAEQVTVRGGYAYAACNSGGLYVFDVSTPSAPSLEGDYDSPGVAWDVEVRGDYAFLADESALEIVDISDPALPVFEGSRTMAQCRDVTLYGDYALMSCYQAGLNIIDISNPASPTHADNYSTGGYPNHVHVSNDTGYIANVGQGLLVVDLSDPLNISRIASCYTVPPKHLTYDGAYVYMSSGYGFDIVGELVLVPGDIDGNGGGPDIADLVFMVNYMFQGGPPPVPVVRADIDGDCTGPNIADLVHLVTFMFQNGPPPVPCP